MVEVITCGEGAETVLTLSEVEKFEGLMLAKEDSVTVLFRNLTSFYSSSIPECFVDFSQGLVMY